MNDSKVGAVYTTDVKHEALQYITLGLPIIPICSSTHQGMNDAHKSKCHSPGKAPLAKNWSTREKTTLTEIHSWFAQCQFLNIGVPLGKVSHLVGIDIDGQSGEKMLQEISKGDIPSTWEFNTGKGRRLLYKLPEGLQTKKMTLAGQGAHEGFEIICDGQQTVLPPSVHSTGRIYRWKEKCGYKDLEPADAPEWIINQIKIDENGQRINTKEQIEPQSTVITKEDWKKDLIKGQRNVEMTRRAGSLIGRGMPKNEVKEQLEIWNNRHCKPPLLKDTIITIVESIALAEEAKKMKKVTKAGVVKVIFRPTPFCKLFLNLQKEQGFSWKFSADMGSFFRCNDLSGPWERLDLVFVQSEVRKALKDEQKGGNKQWDTVHYIMEGIEALKGQLVKNNEVGLFDLGYTVKYKKHIYDPSEIICLKNGIFYWKTLELKPWTSNIYTTITLPVDWDPKAQCHHWIQALSEWIPYPETIKFLQEFIGLCLIPDTSFEIAVFLYGSGANGKSMFLDTIISLFGKALVSIPLHKLTNRFEIAYLQNKLINICGDIDAKYISETGVLKRAITGDVLRGEFKHGKSFDFWPVCKFLFSANTLPKVADKTAAWYRRWKFLEFPKVFPINPSYKIEHAEIFEKEKSGILKWAIEGLQRLKEKNQWTISKGMRISADDYRRESDNVAAFLYETVNKIDYVGASLTRVPTQALHGFYCEWLEKFMVGSKPVGQIEFSKRVQALGFSKKGRLIERKMYSTFLGMRVKEEYYSDYRYYKNMLGKDKIEE